MKISILLSLLLGLGIVYLAWQRLQFREERISTTAMVSDISQVKNMQQGGQAFNTRVTVNFQPTRHETEQASFITKKPINFAVGDTIEIYYSPKNRQHIAWKNDS